MDFRDKNTSSSKKGSSDYHLEHVTVMFTCFYFSKVYSAVQYLSLSTEPSDICVADTYILLGKTCNQKSQIVSSMSEYPKIAMVWLILLLSPLLHMCLILFPACSRGLSRIRNQHNSSLGSIHFCPCVLKENRIFLQCQIPGTVDKDIWEGRELMCLPASKPPLDTMENLCYKMLSIRFLADR